MNTDKETCDDCDRLVVIRYTIDGVEVKLCDVHYMKRTVWGY